MSKTAAKILVVEDEVLIADYIVELLNELGFINVEVAYTVNSAIEYKSTFSPEIVILDINLEGNKEGIALANTIFKEKLCVFLTAQNDIVTVKEALATKPLHYLTKPIRKVDLLSAITIATQQIKDKTIQIKEGYNTISLKHSEIVYVKSDNNYIDIFTQQKKYTVRMSLEAFLKNVGVSDFAQTHRSYIINKNYISKISSKSIYLGRLEIPLSKKHQTQFR